MGGDAVKLPQRLVRQWVWVLALAGVVFAIALATGMLEDNKQAGLLTAPVVVGSIEETVLANGVLEPARMVNVGAQVNGQIDALHVSLGQKVKAGDLIATIDSLPQSNALRIAEAALANVTAQHKARSIQLRQAVTVYRRQASLLSQKAASRLDVETAEAAYKTLEAEVAALQAQMVQAGVEVETARVNLGYTRIIAPMDGVVIAVITKQGQTLNSAQTVPTIVVLAQLDTMRMKIQISEADVGRAKPGQKVWFKILGDRQTRYEAVLAQIEPAPTSMSSEAGIQAAANPQGTAAIYYNGLLELPNPASTLRPLMTAQVNIVLARVSDTPLIPWSALAEPEADGRYRVRVRTPDGKSQARLVTIGLSDKVQAQVLDGLSVGDEVVLRADGPLSEPVTGGML
ncbi:macrolide-specific efflux system membrane fusion protein [Phyllobacterium myrsinacearum]|nr:macrolide-specific efflux system membrane fusion protein [Phyllobacterium myrsinacearum]